jgi:replication initiation and membrane attachment protein DnaB
MSTSKSNLTLDLTEEEELTLYRMAHEKGITADQMVEEILSQIIKEKGNPQMELPFDE